MKVVVIGGVAAGAAFAARMRRLNESARIIIFERGEHVSFANCGLPYYLGDVINDRDRLLLQTVEGFQSRFDIDVRLRSEVISIQKDTQKVTVMNLATETSYEECYDKLILAPGAAPVLPPFALNKSFVHTIRTIADIDRLKLSIKKSSARTAVVIGGGFIGIEMAENFVEIGISPTIVELQSTLLSNQYDPEMAAIFQNNLLDHGVSLCLGCSVVDVHSKKDGSILVKTTEREICTDLVVCSIGVKPELKLAEMARLETNRFGLVVTEEGKTSDDNIYAAGDVVSSTNKITGQAYHLPLAFNASRMGVCIANTLNGIPDSQGISCLGTSIVKMFSLQVGSTGCNEKALSAAHIPYCKLHLHHASHASYYPNSHLLAVKVLFSKTSHRLLGAQIMGKEGVDKRIDQIAVAIQADLTLENCADSELCYAPPFGTAKSTLNVVGMVGINHCRGISRLIHWNEVNFDKDVFLDVRTTDEVERSVEKIKKCAINIPVDSLRGEMDKFLAVNNLMNRRICVFCAVGVRAHVALRILAQHPSLKNHPRIYNVSGGYKTYLNFTEAMNMPLFSKGKELKQKEYDSFSSSSSTERKIPKPVRLVDCIGMCCPGPMVRFKHSLDSLKNGESFEMIVDDHSFGVDCQKILQSSSHNLLEKFVDKDSNLHLIVEKVIEKQETPSINSNSKGSTMVIFSSDFDKVFASLIIARGAIAAGRDVTLFFTFWGLSALKKQKPTRKPPTKTFLEKMFSMMLPKSIKNLALSKMHMGGIGKKLIQYIMKKNNVPNIQEMLDLAIQEGVKIVACKMSMDLMGFKEQELIDGVTIAGVGYYLGEVENSTHNLFI